MWIECNGNSMKTQAIFTYAYIRNVRFKAWQHGQILKWICQLPMAATSNSKKCDVIHPWAIIVWDFIQESCWDLPVSLLVNSKQKQLLSLIAMHAYCDCKWKTCQSNPAKESQSPDWTSVKGHCTEVSHVVFLFQISHFCLILLSNIDFNPLICSIYPVYPWNKFIFAIFQTKFKHFWVQSHVLSSRNPILKWRDQGFNFSAVTLAWQSNSTIVSVFVLNLLIAISLDKTII